MYMWARDTSRAQWVMGMMGGWYVMGGPSEPELELFARGWVRALV